MIALCGINREFVVGDQTVHALSDINLQFDSGEYVSVMGPSGSGKSTLLNIIALLDRPTSGQYQLNQKDVTQQSDNELARLRRENIGFVFQFFHLIPRLSAAENIEMPLILAGIEPAKRKILVDEAIHSVGLADREAHRPDQLSGGQRQRVAIARATIMGPAFLLADEPTGNLDRNSGHEIIELLESLNRNGMTLIVITHDPELGDRAQRHVRLVDGRITVNDHARE